jgi:hypothetical protein
MNNTDGFACTVNSASNATTASTRKVTRRIFYVKTVVIYQLAIQMTETQSGSPPPSKSLSPLSTKKRKSKKKPLPLPLEDEDVEESSAVYFRIFKAFQYALLYFASSIALTLFIKHVITYSDTKYPLTNLSAQMGLNTIISGIVAFFILRYKLLQIYDRKDVTPILVLQRLFRFNIFKKLVPFGCLSGLDYGLSNLSFVFITVTLYTMIKSGTFFKQIS